MIRKTIEVPPYGISMSLELHRDMVFALKCIWVGNLKQRADWRLSETLKILGFVECRNNHFTVSSLGARWLCAPEDPPVLEFAGKTKPAGKVDKSDE